jgi:hypothetical protein
LTAIGYHCLGIYTVILLPLLSLSVNTTVSPRARFFYPGDVPLEHGPTAVIPGSHYPAVDRIDPTTNLHVVHSEDGLPQVGGRAWAAPCLQNPFTAEFFVWRTPE